MNRLFVSLPLLVFGVLTLVGVGCTTQQTGVQTVPQEMSSEGDNMAGDVQQGETAVSIKNFSFSPTTITVKKGTRVTWTNDDLSSHTVTSDTAGGFDSGNLSRGETFSFTFDEIGTFTYHCKIHPRMQATIVVGE